MSKEILSERVRELEKQVALLTGRVEGLMLVMRQQPTIRVGPEPARTRRPYEPQPLLCRKPKLGAP
jgi:hypothetical protein